jgi:class 3 adenylate cyclase
MTDFTNIFSLQDSRATKMILVIDMTNSTLMKERHSEGTWLMNHLAFFRLATQEITQRNGQVVKSTGDGIFAIFEETDAAQAINAAIAIQEKIDDDNQSKRLEYSCSIGLAFGDVIELQFSEAGRDYIGPTADRASRLCQAANSNAIFADIETISAAAMTQIISKYGKVDRRTTTDYHGKQQSVQLKGITSPVEYFEIYWAKDKYGISPEFITDKTQNAAPKGLTLNDIPAPSPSASNAIPSAPPLSESKLPASEKHEKWLKGKIEHYNNDKEFGLIKAGNESYWFNQKCLFIGMKFKVDDQVMFIAIPPLPNGKNERASKIFIFGSNLSGKLTNVLADKGFGFTFVKGIEGETRSMLIRLTPNTPLKKGDKIKYTLDFSPKGPVGKLQMPEPQVPASANRQDSRK